MIILETAVLKVIKGNLFELVPEKCIIAHGCNAQGVMGAGFAKQIKERYPEAYETYIKYHSEHGLNLGSIVPWGSKDSHIIVNCVTQEYYGRDQTVVYVSYEHVEKTLRYTAKNARRLNLPVYFPFIGGGLANGNHGNLITIFERVFEDVEAYLVIND